MNPRVFKSQILKSHTDLERKKGEYLKYNTATQVTVIHKKFLLTVKLHPRQGKLTHKFGPKLEEIITLAKLLSCAIHPMDQSC